MVSYVDARKRQTEKARSVRHELTEKNDSILLEHIRENPNITSVQLEDFLRKYSNDQDWSFRKSYLINALKRLEKKELVTWRLIQRDKKFVKLYYYNYDQAGEGRNPGEIEILKKMLKVPEQWKSVAFIYALANNEIRISPTVDAKLEQDSLTSEKIPVMNNDEMIMLRLPKHIVKFYNLDPKNYTLEITNDNTLLIQIIPELRKSTETSQSRKNILIMEDNDYWAENLKDRFVKEGHEAHAVKTPREAIDYFKHNSIDYIILDWDIGGKRVAEEIFLEMKWKNKDIRASLITANPITDNKWKEFTKLGFISIIRKQRNTDQSIDEIAKKELARMGTV